MSSLSLLASLFAETRDDPLSRPEIIWGTLGLTAALLGGAAVIYMVDKWRKRAAEGASDDTESLTSFRSMYEAGEITEAEYAELKRRVAEKVKKLPSPAAPVAPTAAAPGPAFNAGLLAAAAAPPPPSSSAPTPPAAPTNSPPPPSTA